MKKIIALLAVAVVVCFLLPQVALASWWNPFTWHWNILSIFFKPQNSTAQISGPVAPQNNPETKKEVSNNPQETYGADESKPKEPDIVKNAEPENPPENSVAPKKIQVQPVQPEPAMSIEQQKAPWIISVSDSLGNVEEADCSWETTHYGCIPKSEKNLTVSVKLNPQITFTVNAKDPNGRPILYRLCDYGNGGCYNWVSDVVRTVDLTGFRFGQQVFSFTIKNDDNYGLANEDADLALYYDIEE